LSGLGAAFTKGLDAAVHFHAKAPWQPLAGTVAAGVDALPSLASAVVGVRNASEGHEKAGDRMLMAGKAVSDTFSAATAAASGAIQAATGGYAPDGVGPVPGVVAGFSGLARGATDIVAGGYQFDQARKRRNKLQEIENQGGKYAGFARFGKQSQTARMMDGAVRGIGGVAAAAGGALLLASNPVGWTLLGAAGAVGAAGALAKKLHNYQRGKQLTTDTEYRDQLEKGGVPVPDDEKLKLTSRSDKLFNLFTTKDERRLDAQRGLIAHHLAGAGAREPMDEESGPAPATGAEDVRNKIIDHLGLKPANRNSGGAKKRQKRAKAFARALG
ncbi:MAG TPA: hypothetical protein VGB66_06720, partial [Longimicrobium sp.]